MGASLLAIASSQAALMLNVRSPSRASSLPQITTLIFRKSALNPPLAEAFPEQEILTSAPHDRYAHLSGVQFWSLSTAY
ncbi:hypothetical protein EIY72_27715 [Pseudomonas vancouverensis]|uniref:Uncharacterized protein n=1 Tax=Pseudomonas vancouverensis TaxID=95300 RepID=A0A4R4JRI2_PSEVA|nr:hypothetical protein F7R09_00070 [Pseudomonas vancouverensis]TDB56586.1 hypothetical protein EIY72_27715 [Pseudomonas vancouverensis]